MAKDVIYLANISGSIWKSLYGVVYSNQMEFSI